ncbi:MAG: hypothetical protein Q8S13_05380, partial [Dehalococcoidia bacterium]|nr:hypothetical protein [Dehalococcoidia bacterium]
KGARAAAMAVTLAASSGCYHYLVQVPNTDPATEWQKRTVVSYAWGLVGDHDTHTLNCEPSNALNDVRTTTNLGYIVLTTLTLGLVAPAQVEWRCAKRHEPPSVVRPASLPAAGKHHG